MFKLNHKPSATYFWPVTVRQPLDVDKYDEQAFEAEFKRLSTDEVAALEKDTGYRPDQLVRRVVVGWREVTDDGKPIEFTPEAFEMLLQVPAATMAIFGAFYESLTGRVRGN